MWICCLWFDFGMGQTTKGDHLKNAIRINVQVRAESPQTKKSWLMTVTWLELLTWTLASHFLPPQVSGRHFSTQNTLQNMKYQKLCINYDIDAGSLHHCIFIFLFMISVYICFLTFFSGFTGSRSTSSVNFKQWHCRMCRQLHDIFITIMRLK